MHLGNLRTALLNFLLSKQSKGSFILRIEDTDKERSKKEFAESICDDLTWMDLNWEEGPRTGGPQEPYFQSERNQLYEKFYAELIDKDRSEEHTSELQSRTNLVCRLLLEKKK